MDLLKVTVKHRYGESKEISESKFVVLQLWCLEGYPGNGIREEQQLQLKEYYEEKFVNNHDHRSRSALPLGSHEQFHRRVHPEHTRTRTCDLTTESLTEGAFVSPVNKTDLLPKLARNTTAVCPGAPQPPKVAFIDTTITGIKLDDHSITPPCSHLFSFCHYCGRSSGIRLAWCLHCQNVVYCSQSCRQNHWDEGHKTECTDPKMHKRCEYNEYIHIQGMHRGFSLQDKLTWPCWY